jgi:HK97 family phage major capsid protein/HK97 family phage prohead protease
MKNLNLMTRDAADRSAHKVVQRLQELRKETQRREAKVGHIDVEARTVELSFSSEIEYQRWWGIEVLGHDATEVRLGRLQDNAAVLWNHNWDDQRGVVVPGSVTIGDDRKGRAVARFATDDDGEKLFQRIVDGIVTKVSVGYVIHGLKLVEEREDVDVYRVTDWEPHEISMVSVPADGSVGVGRGLEKPQEEATGKSADTAPGSEKTPVERTQQTLLRMNEKMNIKTLRDGAGNLVRAEVDESGSIVKVLEVLEAAGADRRGLDDERTRVRSITDLGKTYGKADMALQYVAEGKTAEDFQRALLHDFAAQRGQKPLDEQQRDANIGMTGKEVRNFSIMRAIRALANPESKAFRDAAAFEFEASRTAAELYGKNPKGIIIPNDVLASRAFSVTTANGGNAAGAAAVAHELLDGSFIGLLRKKAWVMRRARTLAGLVGNVDIPRQNASGSAYWVGEGGAPTPGSPGVDQVAFTPKTVGAYTDITRRLMLQSTPDAEFLVRDDLLKILALEIDRVSIYGSGSANQPLGVKNITGINAVDFAAANPTFAEVVAMETAIALDDADVEAMSYAFNATMRGHFKTTAKLGAGTSATIWEQGNTVNGYEANVSNQVAAGDAFFGNWQDLVIAMWGGLDLIVDTASLSTSGGLRLIALQDVDMNVRHKESFCWGSALVA